MTKKIAKGAQQLSPQDEKVILDVDQFGCHVVNVLEDEDWPPHCFSIGLFHNYQHPEILIIGLKASLMHNMINAMRDKIKEGVRFESGRDYDGFIDGFNVTFRDVAKVHYKEYLGFGMWFYDGDDFPTLQCIWPTTKGYFPWDKKYPKDLVQWQRLLDKE